LSLLFAARWDKYREEKRQTIDTNNAIACLSMRDIADRVLQDVLSEPTELLREFSDDNEFENLIRQVDRENASICKEAKPGICERDLLLAHNQTTREHDRLTS
jgi:hypothetical protein